MGKKTFIFFILANFLACVSCQNQFYTVCGNNGNFTVNNAYQKNLNTLLPSLSPNVDDNGFYNTSVGENSDTVYGTVLCRNDLQLETCRLCIRNNTNNLLRSCPNQVEAVSWTFFCMVRYSNLSMFGILTRDPYQRGTEYRNVTTSPTDFRSDLKTLLDSLLAPAANGGNLRKFAIGNRSTSGVGETIYAMAQCNPELSADNCYSCLTAASKVIPVCCDMRVWATIYMPSCSVRYETEPFYNESRLNEVVGVPIPNTSPGGSMPNAPSGNSNNNNKNTSRIIIIGVSVAGAGILAVIVGFILRKRIKKRPEKEFHINEEDISMAESLQYDFDKIRSATNDFSSANKLGQGGFGVVYRGVLQNGNEIAVKRLSKDSCQGDLEFKNEVTLLAKLQHRNLVRLLGFSLVGNEKLLVYEYLRNASLDHFIFGKTRSSNLDWDLRYKIIGGIAKGLLYLHEDSRLRIIHRDLKAGNILLDDQMNPKIADFGTARLFVPDETQANTLESLELKYAIHGQCSVKLDVFSFGILVLEIISGQRNNTFRNHENEADLLTSSAWKYWQKGTAANLVDNSLKVGSGLPSDILRCIHVSLLCVQENPVDRPTMASVVLMLSSSSITLPLPSKPAYFIVSGNYPEDSITRDLNDTITHSSSSTKEMTITLLDAR